MFLFLRFCFWFGWNTLRRPQTLGALLAKRTIVTPEQICQLVYAYFIAFDAFLKNQLECTESAKAG